MRLAVLAALSLAAAAFPHAHGAPAERWVGTWAAAPQSALPGAVEHYKGETLRLIVHTSLGGRRVRIRLSNLYGKAPLILGAAHIARRTDAAAIDPSSDRTITFDGRDGVSIAPGSDVLSDPVDLDVRPLSDLAVSLYLLTAVTASTTHILAQQTSYVGRGDQSGAAQFPVAATITSWPFLIGVDVQGPGDAIVAFGDSTVDGDGSTPDANQRWPDLLAARLQREGRQVGVLNEGMIGNRLLRGSPDRSRKDYGSAFSPSGLRRFARDALDAPGVACVVIRIGSNDFGFPGTLAAASERARIDDMAPAFRELVRQAQQQGVRVIGTTIPPFKNATLAAGYATAAKDDARRQTNAWLRSSGAFDALADVDAVLRDPDHPSQLAARFDSGDHLHPNDAGYAAMADAVAVAVHDGCRLGASTR